MPLRRNPNELPSSSCSPSTLSNSSLVCHQIISMISTFHRGLLTKCTYFAQGETCCALCNTGKGTIFLLQHHLPWTCPHIPRKTGVVTKKQTYYTSVFIHESNINLIMKKESPVLVVKRELLYYVSLNENGFKVPHAVMWYIMKQLKCTETVNHCLPGYCRNNAPS